MLTVTEPVLKQLDKAIAKAEGPEVENQCVRLVRGEQAGLALKLQVPKEGDTTFEYEGRTVLAVPESCVEICADKTLDINEEGRLMLA
ncbi:MAG TPA: hypothetical protein VMO24_05155 [Woeseiaceae bacterium]|nr:hypothetical protein [Woeseiaceae bacterium]